MTRTLLPCVAPLLVLVLAGAVSVAAQSSDERQIKALTLDNGIEVYLVHDPAADHSAAALAVEAGSIQDGDTAGIAHFLEHMLFLGTGKYPDPGDYKDFLAANDGDSNAYTSFEHTNYHFSVKNEAFEGALDRFSRFFIDPTITDTLSGREVNAVDSEHSKNLQDEYWRARQVYRSLLNPKHPQRGFTTGNKQTLAGVKNERLWDFYRRYYSANLMHLTIVSNHPLDKLEAWVREKFSPIENKKLPVPTVAEKMFHAGIAGHRIDVQSLTDYDKMWIRFELPPEVFDHETKPAHLISAILGHEGQESLLQQLKEEGLATSLSTSPDRIGQQGEFDMTIGLTAQGLAAPDTVMERVFGMINHLRGLPEFPKYLFEEEQKMAELHLRFRSPSAPVDEARGLAASMVELPHENLLENFFLIRRFDAALTKKVLDALTPENSATVVIAKDRKGDKTEEYYGASYAIAPLAPALVERLKQAKPIGKMGLPAPNPFIPSDFALVETSAAAQPVKLELPVGEIWLRHDTNFRQPRAALRLRIGNRFNAQSARDYVLGQLFAEAANVAMNPYRYPTTQGGMDLKFSSEREGLVLEAEGFSHKLPELVAVAAPFLTEVKVDEQQFGILRETMLRGLKNKARQQPNQKAFDVFREVMREVHYTDEAQLAVLDGLTRADLVEYAARARQEIWIEGFVYGNLTAERVREMGTGVTAALAPKRALAPSERWERRVLTLPPGTSVTVKRPIESNDSVTMLLYEHDPFNPVSRPAFHVLQQVVANRFYQDLRTLQQTGYIVYAGGIDLEGMPLFYFLSQSSVVDTAELRGRFESFLRHLPADLEEMKPEEFEAARQSARSELLTRRKDFKEELGWNFYTAFGQYADFGYLEREAKEIDGLTREQWLEWTAKFFAEDLARRVCIELVGSPARRAYPERTVEELRKGATFTKRPAPGEKGKE